MKMLDKQEMMLALFAKKIKCRKELEAVDPAFSFLDKGSGDLSKAKLPHAFDIALITLGEQQGEFTREDVFNFLRLHGCKDLSTKPDNLLYARVKRGVLTVEKKDGTGRICKSDLNHYRITAREMIHEVD